MPLENTSRSPRRANWRGRKPSLARSEASTGKPLKAVLAARIRIAAVNAWTAKNPIESIPNTAPPICAITVRCV